MTGHNTPSTVPSPFTPARRKRIKSLTVVALLAAMMLITGCNSATTGALLGAAIGSAAGAGIDHNNRGRGTLIGAGVGTVAGYLFGNEADKSQAQNTGYRGGYQPNYAEPTYAQPAPRYYEPEPAYYYPPAQIRVDYYEHQGNYCPPPRYHHHHSHHSHRRHW